MAARHWTDEQRKAQAQKIRQHKIWLKSTGATSEEGKKKVSQNALKTGEYTADKVKERKRKAAKKRLWGWGCSYGDKRYTFNRSIKYSKFYQAFKPLSKTTAT